MTNISKIVQGLLYPTLSPILGRSTCITLKEVNLLLSVNIVSFYSHRRNGALGHLVLMMSPVI